LDFPTLLDIEPYSTEGIEWRERKAFLEDKIKKIKNGEYKEKKIDKKSDKLNSKELAGDLEQFLSQ